MNKRSIRAVLCMLMMALAVIFVMPQTVQAAPKLSAKKMTLIKGQSKKLKVKNGSGKVTWSTSNKTVATVTSKGKVSAKKKGSATITAAVGTKKLKCKVTVEAPELSDDELDMEIGDIYTLKLSGTKQKVKWATSAKSIVSVTTKGQVKALREGEATITATVAGKKYKCYVTVNEPEEEDPALGSLEIIVKSANGGEPVEGVYFDVLENGEEEEVSYITEADGRVFLEEAYVGRCVITLTDVPDGYTMPSKTEAVCEIYEGKTSKVEYTIPVALNDMKIVVKDDAGAVVPSVEVLISGDEIDDLPAWTDENGEILVTNLPYGDYSVDITKIPAGYEASEIYTKDITIDDGDMVICDFTVNKKVDVNDGDDDDEDLDEE